MAQAINFKPFRHFFRSEQIGGIILIFSVLISFLIANSTFGAGFDNLLSTEFGYSSTHLLLEYSVSQWINDGLYSPLGLGIIFGLALGKPLGVTLFSWIAVKSGIAALPSRANWKHIFGLGLLAGIGFTMSIVIALLSFNNPQYDIEAKFSILVASVLAGISGFVFLFALNKKRKKRLRKARGYKLNE